jgi:predicted PurR-regulated permease PerM
MESDQTPRPTVGSTPGGARGQGPLIAVFAILVVVALRLASALLVPIAISILLSLLLGPQVRWLRKHRIPESIGAGLLVFGTVTLLGIGTAFLAAPAAGWVRRGPALLSQIETKVRQVIRPFHAIQVSALKVEQAASGAGAGAGGTQKVEMQTPGLVQRVSVSTISAVGATLGVAFLTYFLLATGQRLRRRLVGLPAELQHQERMEHALNEIERQTSRYLAFTTLISIGVGGATWVLLRVAAVPNAGLWATLAGGLNFIPYVGALVSAVLIGTAALLTFDGIERPLVVVGGFLLIHLVAGNLVTPAVLGRKLPLNTVALFICLLFWGWVWGVPGVILAVPMTVMLKVIADHVEHLRPLAVLLGD